MSKFYRVATITLLVFCCLIGSQLARAGSYEEGREAYINGDYKKAFSILSPLAKEGDSEAQKMLGIMYDYGQGVAQDFKEAEKWYRLLAEQGNALAQARLGMAYHFGKGVPQDFKEAVKWYWLSAKQGNTKAQTELGLIFVECLLGIFILGLIFKKYLKG